MEITYKDGESVTLDYDANGHTYRIGRDKIPSVTKIVGKVTPKNGLVEWAAIEGANFFRASVEPHRLSPTEEVGMFMLPVKVVDHIAEGIKTAHKVISEEAKQTGHIVHDWCERAILWKLGHGEQPEIITEPSDVANSINAFREWVKETKIEWVSTEEKVYNREHKYAGTVDAVGRIGGNLCVMDFKTSNAIRKEYYLQVSAYAKAIEDIYGEPVDVCYILRFDKKSGEFQEKAVDPYAHWDAFLAAKQLHHWHGVRVMNYKYSPELRGPDA